MSAALIAAMRAALQTADRTFAENGLLACHAARKEIRAALAEQPAQEAIPADMAHYNAIAANYAAAQAPAPIAQPEEAPTSTTTPNLACKSVQARLAAQWGYVRAPIAQPLHPWIQRQQPFTDTQIDAILDHAGVSELPAGYESLDYEIARAIERAHGISAQEPAP